MGKNRKKNKSTRKTRAIHEDNQDAEFKSAPHSFVFHRGKVGVNVRTLVLNLRQVMEPFTASKLQISKSNVLKDFVNVAGVLNVSHFVMFSKTDKYIQMRIARVPRGPTLTFQVREYCLGKDVLSAQKKPNLSGSVFSHHPLLVMNGFTAEEKSVQLMMTMFQNMFPSISVNKVNLNHIRRCVLISYNPDTKLLDFRHYTISLSPVGVSRGVKKLTKTKLPDLGKYDDISEYIERGGNLSESEAEQDGPHNEVTLPQKMHGRGNLKLGQSAVRLKEIGPRMTLELVKIEEGLCDGAVIYHAFIHKTAADLEADKKKKAEKLKLKQTRRAKQAENLKRKEKLKEEHKQRTLEGMKRKEEQTQADAVESDSDDDIAHYKKEVGVNPDSELFPSQGHSHKRKKTDQSNVPRKKMKTSNRSSNDSQHKPKKVVPPGFRKKEQVAKQKKKKLLLKKLGKDAKPTKKSGFHGKSGHPGKSGQHGKSGHTGKSGERKSGQKGKPGQKKFSFKGKSGHGGFKSKHKKGN